jgi:hypothetical protein
MPPQLPGENKADKLEAEEIEFGPAAPATH